MKKKLLIAFLLCFVVFVGLSFSVKKTYAYTNDDNIGVGDSGIIVVDLSTVPDDEIIGVLLTAQGQYENISVYVTYSPGSEEFYVYALNGVSEEVAITSKTDTYTYIVDLTGYVILTMSSSSNYPEITINFYSDRSFVITILDGLSTLMTNIGLMFVNIFTAAAGIVYNSSTGLTTIGWLMLIGLGIALFMFGLRFIKSLINRARAR